MANEDFAARLKTFAFLLKYGHDLFEAESFADAAANAVNNARPLLNFTSSSLFTVIGRHVELAAQFGTPEANPHARLAVVQKAFVEAWTPSAEPVLLDSKNLPEEMTRGGLEWLVLTLLPPKRAGKTNLHFVWLIGYEKEVPTFAANTAKLVSNSMSDALYFHRLCPKKGWSKVKYHAKRRWFWIFLLLIVTALMFVRVPESANAEFVLKAPEIKAAYAWFDGPVAKCLKQDGETVKQGETIIVYETDQLDYRLKMAESALKETEAELAVEEQNAFTDPTKLGQVELLKAKRESLQLAVEEAQWYLDRAAIKAPADGVLALTDGRAELLAGKAVRTGDKLFEVLGGEGKIAEISVSERDGSVLYKNMTIELFLYTSPEKAIPVKIENPEEDISHYPELTEQKTYCYKIRAELPEGMTDLRLGMRGIAKISGSKVPLGYYLFKSVVLYFRGL